MMAFAPTGWRTSTWLAAILVIVLPASAFGWDPVSPAPRTLTITQTIDAAGRSTVDARTALIGWWSDGMDAQRLTAPLPADVAIAAIVPGWKRFADTSSTFLAAVERDIAGRRDALFASMTAALARTGAFTAWYRLEQDVEVAGRPRRLSWTATVDSRGRALYGAPVFADDPGGQTYAVYTPLSARRGLPDTWQYPAAGLLMWRRIDAAGTASSPWQTIDTAGAFDAVRAIAGDPDGGIRCLVDATVAGCRSGLPDLRTIMDRTGTGSVLFDYVRAISPDYVDQPGGGRAAVAAVDVTQRTVERVACAVACRLRYTNHFRIGYRVRIDTDRLLAFADGRWSPLARYSGVALSPVQDTERVLYLSDDMLDRLDSLVIRPDTGALVDLADMPDGQFTHVAALERIGR